MIERRLVRQLEKAAGRVRHLHLVLGWAVLWTVAATAAFILLALNRGVGLYWPLAAPVLAAVAGVAALVIGWLAIRSARDYQEVARQVEECYPELRAGLLAAVDQRPQFPNGRFSYLQSSVIQQALHHAYANSWQRVVSWSRLLTAHAAHLASFIAFAAAIAGLAVSARPRSTTLAPEDEIKLAAAGNDFVVAVEPGNAEVERGTSLLVMARFSEAVPLEATLVYEQADELIRVPMTKRLDDPVFGGRIPEVNDPLGYRVEFAEHATDEYNVTVFEFPRLVRADARLTFPNYTSQEEKLVQDVRRISAVEGTRLQLLCYLNKQVSSAKLVGKDNLEIKLAPHDDEQSLYAAEMVLTKSQRFELHLIDDAGRANKQPPRFIINVLPNKPPDLKLVQPSRDMRVSPIEELDLKANVWDDYGVTRFGLAYSLGATEPTDVELGTSAPAKQRTPIEHLVAFEELGAEPDQLLAYHFWAEDTGPSGQVRRVSSDMFFAEVRHFEEIFREGQSPPGGQQQQQQGGQNAQAAEKLAELQKQIINATWKVMRRELLDRPTDKFAGDVELVSESQVEAITQAQALTEQLEDRQSLEYVRQVLQHMSKALTLLSEAKTGADVDKLQPALIAEQAAYQALLKLRAQEFEVVQQQQRQSSSSSSSSSSANRSRQQLQQLELDSERNRYEAERTAQSQQEQMDRENRQVLNRLKELARRQSDLNERLKELQSALEEAETEEEREEILRQLKRLQEEQQQIMRDTEELQERMERPENQEQMAEAREQLEQTRNNTRQASEALEEGRVSRALASGARAERELEELREEFRRRTSGRFNEEMREMRQQARELDETEQNLSERIEELNDPKARSNSLRETDDREQIVEEMAAQAEGLKDLMERMRDTVLEAEETEPLLADQLYDSVRKAQQQDLDDTLNKARRMLEYGFVDDAKREEREVREGIGELREGVERAAKSVLGDETEALRRAQNELERLSEELEGEISRSNPRQQSENEREEDSSGQSDQPRQGSQPGEQQDPESESDSAQQQPGERQEQPSDSESSQRPQDGRPNESEQQSESPRSGSQPGGPSDSQSQSPSEASENPSDSDSNSDSQQPQAAAGRSNDSLGGFERLFQEGLGGPNRGGPDRAAPISGDDYVEWADRLRDVEEMLDDPELRAEAARIRDRARGFRVDLKRHSKEPSWNLVELQVAEPLAELRDRVAEELLKRTNDDAVVPLDRDPVPSRFKSQVERYYERLGSGN
jgi:hypothetical protein